MQQIVDVETLAEYFKVEVRTVQLWAKDDGMPKLERGQYDLVECARWKIQQLKKEIEKLKAGDEELAKWDRENARMAAEERALKIAKLKNEVMPRKDARSIVIDIAKTFANALAVLERKLPARLIGLTDLKEMQKMISEETTNIRNNIERFTDHIPDSDTSIPGSENTVS